MGEVCLTEETFSNSKVVQRCRQVLLNDAYSSRAGTDCNREPQGPERLVRQWHRKVTAPPLQQTSGVCLSGEKTLQNLHK
jgi:hypothetical protein